LNGGDVCPLLSKRSLKSGTSETFCCRHNFCNNQITPITPITTPVPLKPLQCFTCTNCGFNNIGTLLSCPIASGFVCAVRFIDPLVQFYYEI